MNDLTEYLSAIRRRAMRWTLKVMGRIFLDWRRRSSPHKRSGFITAAGVYASTKYGEQRWLGFELDSRRGGGLRNQRPRHARRVVRDADAAFAVEEDDAAMPIEP